MKAQMIGVSLVHDDIEFPAIVNTSIQHNVMSIEQLVGIKSMQFLKNNRAKIKLIDNSELDTEHFLFIMEHLILHLHS